MALSRIGLALAIVMGTVLPLCGVAQAGAEEIDATLERAGELIPRHIAAGQATGVALALSAPGHDTLLAGYGTSGAANAAAVTADTVFEIGSISKIFTNLLLADLVLEGRLALEDAAQDHMPEGLMLPEKDGRQITIFDLATHHSGLPSVPPAVLAASADDPYADFSGADLADFLAGFTLPRAPGQSFEYSNTGTTLLGLALETASGQSHESLVKERILMPLGMDSTFVAVPADRDFAQGHDINGDATSDWNLGLFTPAGGWRSTARDMGKFIAAASGAESSALDPAFVLMLETFRPTGMGGARIGLGWFESNGIIWHNGMTGGFNALMAYRPETGAGLVLLSNQVTSGGIDALGVHLLDPNKPYAERTAMPPEFAVPEDVLADYVGLYRLTPDFALDVTHMDGRLYVQGTGQGRLRVRALSETEFGSPEVDALVRFLRNEPGAIVGLELYQNGVTQRAERE